MLINKISLIHKFLILFVPLLPLTTQTLTKSLVSCMLINLHVCIAYATFHTCI